jgi:hypothetical protein
MQSLINKQWKDEFNIVMSKDKFDEIFDKVNKFNQLSMCSCKNPNRLSMICMQDPNQKAPCP